MALSRQEAQALGYDFIADYHILLGLLKVKDGVAYNALSNMGLNYQEIKESLDKLVGHEGGSEAKGRGMLPFTPRAKSSLVKSVEIAKEWGHDYIGTGDLLYSIFSDRDSVTYSVLSQAGITQDKMRRKIEESSGVGAGKIKKGSEKEIDDSLSEEEVDELVSALPLFRENAEKSEYWHIPKKSVSLENALGMVGFTVNKKIKGFGIYKLIGEREYEVGGFFGVEDKGVVVCYNMEDREQIEEALKLRDFLEENDEEYNEEPPSEEIVKRLKSSISGTTSLIERFRKKRN